MTGAARVGALVLTCASALAIAAPWLPLRDPAAQPDGLVLRTVPPLTRVYLLERTGGTTTYANELRERPGGGHEMRRGESWTPVVLDGASVRRPLYLLGTDVYGRDLLSRIVWGARVSLLAGSLAAILALALGGAVGLTAGLAGGATDSILMRLTDGALAIPRLFLLVLVAALFRPSLATTVLVIGASTWMTAARLVRGETLSLSTRDFVLAARAAGAGPARVAIRHLLPGLAPILAVEAAVRFGQSILLEASLSFLGLGVPPPAPTWGSLIAEGRDRLLDAWWISTWPGVALASVVVAATLLADAGEDGL